MNAWRHGLARREISGAATGDEDAANAPASLTLRANFAWAVVGSAIYGISQWLIIICLARLGSRDFVGVYALAAAITAPFVMLTNFQLAIVQATDYSELRGSFREYVGVRACSVVAFVALILIVLLAWPQDSRTVLVIVIVTIGRCFDSLSDLLLSVPQKQGRMDKVAIGSAINGIVSVSGVALSLKVTHSIVAAAAASTLGSCVALLAFNTWVAALGLSGVTPRRALLTGVSPVFAWPSLRRIARNALPLGGVIFLFTMGLNVPRYFVEHFSGTSGLGVFAAVSYAQAATATVSGALGQAVAPRLARHYALGQIAELRRLLRNVIWGAALFGLALLLLAYVWGRTFLATLYGGDYAAYDGLLIVVMLSTAILLFVAVFGFAMTATGYYYAQAPLFLCAFVVTVVGCYLFVPKYRLAGAAWVMVVTGLIQAIGGALIVRHALERRQRRTE